jgi:hypothetical protein
MKFFLPDWDDRVDPGYDFATDRFSLVRDPYQDDLYAHEVFPDTVYDGMLVSRMALGESGPKRERVERYGMRAYLRLPPNLELLGDCGAYGYVRENVPRLQTAEVLDYYNRLDFDYGVSVDHLIVTEVADQRHFRYELTLRNAEEFLSLYRRGNYRLTPIAAIQGWDVASYVEAAQSVAQMGYSYVGIGGIARSNNRTVQAVVTAVVEALPRNVQVHLFGIARTRLFPLFQELGVASLDSATPLRQAWMSDRDNYYTLDRTYTAIRIPVAAEERPKWDSLVGRSRSSLAQQQKAERAALKAVRAYAKGGIRIQTVMDALMEYDRLLADRLDGQTAKKREGLYRDILRDKPWKRCPCAVCRELGVEVIIFRGNNRNRRRGFHNLWVAWQRMGRTTTSASAPL